MVPMRSFTWRSRADAVWRAGDVGFDGPAPYARVEMKAGRTLIVASSLFLVVTAVAAQEPLSISLVQSDTAWIVTESTTFDLMVVASAAGDGVVLDSLQVELPPDLRCGSREPVLVHRFEISEGIRGPGSTVRVPIEVPEADGSCMRLLDELGRTYVSGQVWYSDLGAASPSLQPFTASVFWRAGAFVILAGALLGAIASALFRLVAGKAGHREALFPEGRSPIWGLALNVLTVVIVVALIRLLPENQLPTPFRPLVADTFGSGFLLGLISNSLVLPLLNLVLKGEGVLPKTEDKPPARTPEDAQAIEV